MDSLKSLKSSLANEWGPGGLYQAILAMIEFLNTPNLPGRYLVEVWEIARLIRKQLSFEDRESHPGCFETARGNWLLQLKLYYHLGLIPKLEILGKLVKLLTKETKDVKLCKIPVFNVAVDPNELTMYTEYIECIVFLANCPPTPYIVRHFLSVHLDERPEEATDENLLKIASKWLAEVTFELFYEEFFPAIKRLLLRSDRNIRAIARILDYMRCDLSGITHELFPCIKEYALNEKTHEKAVILFTALCRKCSDLTMVQDEILKLKDLNETQCYFVLCLLPCIPIESLANTESLLSFTLFLSNRIKKDQCKGAIAECVAHFCIEPTQEIVELLKSNIGNSKMVNLLYRYRIREVAIPLKGLSPLQLAFLLSLCIPSPIPQSLESFLTTESSGLFHLPNLSFDDEEAVYRCVLRGLELYPDSPLLVTKFIRGILSRCPNVREFLFANWPSVSPLLLFPALEKVILSEEALNILSNHSTMTLPRCLESVRSPVELNSFFKLLTSDSLYSLKRVKKYVKLVSKDLVVKFEESCLEHPKVIGILLCSSHHERIFDAIVPNITETTFSHYFALNSYIENSCEDPLFEDFGSLTSKCSEALQLAGLSGSPKDKDLVSFALARIEKSLISRAIASFQGIRYSIIYRESIGSSESFNDFIYQNIIPLALELCSIEDLRLDIWKLLMTLVSHSTSFSRKSSEISLSLMQTALSIDSDRTIKGIFHYIERQCPILGIETRECLLIEPLVLSRLSSTKSSIKSQALALLTDLVTCKKLSSMPLIISTVVSLLEKSGSPLLDHLFPPLFTILDGAYLTPLYKTLPSLEPMMKEILLNNLLFFPSELPTAPEFICSIYLEKFDEIEVIKNAAALIYNKHNLRITQDSALYIANELFRDNSDIQSMAARALEETLNFHPEWSESVYNKAFANYQKNQKQSLTLLIELTCGNIAKELALSTLRFLLEEGMKAKNEHVRNRILEVNIFILTQHGGVLLDQIFTLLQFNSQNSNENIRFSAVVLLGYLSRFFSTQDFRIESTIDLLLNSLNMCSYSIACSVSECLPKLVSFRPSLASSLVQNLMKTLFSDAPLVERRGAAYGLGSITKGVGLNFRVSLHILETIETVFCNKKSTPTEKMGVLLAIEGLSYVLGRAFEPYLSDTLPHIIDCLSEKHLQEQASKASKILISKLSTHGLKKILPLLTQGLQEAKWKSRVGAIEVLGKLAFCGHKQMSSCLHEVVPKILHAFSDTNPSVLSAAKKAIEDIGSVIKNPEVVSRLPVLTKALEGAGLAECFKTLLNTRFCHFIDAPSLSLIVPVVESGLRARDPELKREATQIVGGLPYLLYDKAEIVPYIERILSAFKVSLFDSIPEVRNIAAQNLAVFCGGLPEDIVKTVREMLLNIMRNATNSIERAGSVHAYSEILVSDDSWVGIVEELLENCLAHSATLRESYLGVFLFIASGSNSFSQYVTQVIPVVLKNLDHDNEEVRKISVRVVQTIIKSHFKSSLNSILNPLETGLFSSSPRTRSSCIVLMGDMLEKIESFSRKEGVSLIPLERKLEILASVYILRSDANSAIHTSANSIWENLVDNTQKMLEKLTSNLLLKLVQISDSEEPELLEISRNAVQELIQTYQFKLFSSYLNYFLDYFTEYPRGVAFALSKICAYANKDLIIKYSERIISILENLFSSEDPVFLRNAAGIYTELHKKTSASTTPEVVLALLDFVGTRPKACRELLSLANASIRKAVILRVNNSPLKSAIFSGVADIIANDLFNSTELEHIFPCILKESDTNEETLKLAKLILANITEFLCLETALDMLKATQPREAPLLSLKNTIKMILFFCHNTKLNYESYTSDLLTFVLPGIHSHDPGILDVLPEAIAVVMKPIPKQDYHLQYELFYQEINCAKNVPFFNTEKGLFSYLPVTQNAMIYGEIYEIEIAARGYCYIISLTDREALEKYINKIVGPLLRGMLEKLPSDIKITILDALYLLIQKTPNKMIPFIYQLQTSFLSTLDSEEASMRQVARRNIIELISLKPRIEIIVNELCNLEGPQNVIIDKLGLLDNILEQVTIPNTVKSNALGILIAKLETTQFLSEDAVIYSGRILSSLSMNPSATLLGLQVNAWTIKLSGAMLENISGKFVLEIDMLIKTGIEQCTDSTIKMLAHLATVHPLEIYKLLPFVVTNLRQEFELIYEVLLKLPQELFLRHMDILQGILVPLTDVIINSQTENKSSSGVVIHMFSIAKSGLKNVQKSLHLIGEEYRGVFHQFAEDAMNSLGY